MPQVPNEKGFVLPFVLVSIASLSIVTLAGYRMVSSASDVVIEIDATTRNEINLVSAEAHATFGFLTGSPSTGGIALGNGNGNGNAPTSGTTLARLLGQTAQITETPPSSIWRFNGDVRRYHSGANDVVISFRDSAGLFPLASADSERTEQFFRVMGFDNDIAETMAARLSDYQDIDNDRSFNGAERADYRLFGEPAPTNARLRRIEELGNILGFTDGAPIDFWINALDLASTGSRRFSSTAAPPALQGVMLQNSGALSNIPGVGLGASDLPSRRARFLLSVRSGDRILHRAVEIERARGLTQKPFSRDWIYDRTSQASKANLGRLGDIPLLSTQSTVDRN